jgi:hypothetical protein
MAVTTATVVVHAKKRRPPISVTTMGSAVETTRIDSAWIATPPAIITDTRAFPSRNGESHPAAALPSCADEVFRRSLVSSTGTTQPPSNEMREC